MRILPVLLAATALAAAGCNRDASKAASEAEHEAAKAPAAEVYAPDAVVPEDAAAAPATATVTMRYGCEGGNGVEILSTDNARVTLADGRVVEIPLVAGSSPPAYVGEAVAFAVGSSGAKLSQEEGGAWNCKPS